MRNMPPFLRVRTPLKPSREAYLSLSSGVTFRTGNVDAGHRRVHIAGGERATMRNTVGLLLIVSEKHVPAPLRSS